MKVSFGQIINVSAKDYENKSAIMYELLRCNKDFEFFEPNNTDIVYLTGEDKEAYKTLCDLLFKSIKGWGRNVTNSISAVQDAFLKQAMHVDVKNIDFSE